MKLLNAARCADLLMNATSTIYIPNVQVHYLSVFCLLHFLVLHQMQTAIGTQAPPTDRNTATTTATMVALLVGAIALGGKMISAGIGFKVQNVCMIHFLNCSKILIHTVTECQTLQTFNIPVAMFSTNTIN